MEVVLAVRIGRWRPWWSRFKGGRRPRTTARARQAVSRLSRHRLSQSPDHRVDRRGLWRLIIVVLQLQVPLILTCRLQLHRALGLGRIETVNREGVALRVYQVQPLGRTSRRRDHRQRSIRLATSEQPALSLLSPICVGPTNRQTYL